MRLRARSQSASERQDFVEIRRDFDFIIREVAQPSAIGLNRVKENADDLFQANPLHFRGLCGLFLRIEQFQSWFGTGSSHCRALPCAGRCEVGPIVMIGVLKIGTSMVTT